MNRRLIHLHGAMAICLAMMAFTTQATTAAEFPAEQTDQILGSKGQQMPGVVYKYSWPRSDLRVVKGTIPIEP